MKITEEIKQTYNDHLSVSRSFRRKPFRLRKKFDGFEEDPRFRSYRTLTRWFNKHPEINRKLFFEATLYFHQDEELVPITEYTKTKSITNYTQYCKILETLNLDNPKRLDRVVDSFKFVKNFLKENNLTKNDYIINDPESIYPQIFQHIKSRDVDIYFGFAFPNFFDELKKLYRSKEDWSFYLKNDNFSPNFLLKRYQESVKYRKLSEGIYQQKL